MYTLLINKDVSFTTFFYEKKIFFVEYLKYGYISYAIKKVTKTQLLIFEKNGLVWPADIWPAHFFEYPIIYKHLINPMY